MHFHLSEERKGELFTLGSVAMWAIFPVVIKSGKELFHPLLFAGLSMLGAGLLMLPLMIVRKKSSEILNKKGIVYALINTFLLGLGFMPIVIWAGQNTVAGNTSLLLQSEILFTLLFFRFSGLEKVTRREILGTLFILMGVILILIKNVSGTMNGWDVLLVMGCLLPPIANIYAKKALRLISTNTILVVRNLIAGSILTASSFLFLENIDPQKLITPTAILLILINSLFIFSIRIALGWEGFKRIAIHKAIALGGAAPAIGLMSAFIVLHEIPTTAQILGLIAITFGILQIAHHHKLAKNHFEKASK